MKNYHKKNKILILLVVIFVFSNLFAAFHVNAADVNENDLTNTQTEEIDNQESESINDESMGGDTFYMPESVFHTKYDYEEYCKRMYEHGYMDSNYNWTDDAETYINNPNEKNYEILDKNAKQTIQDRIDRGIMNAEDNPYLTYEEKQAIIKQKEQEENQQSDGDGTNDDGSIVEQEVSVTPEITEHTEHTEQPEQEVTKAPDEEKQEPMSETNKLGKTISYTIIVLAIAIIADIAYSIYIRQF